MTSPWWRRLEIRDADLPHGTAPVTTDLLTECWSSRVQRPDPVELALFDHHAVHERHEGATR